MRLAKQIPAASTYRGDFLAAFASELGYAREEQIAGDGDDDQIGQEKQGPEEIVPDHLAFIAHEARGRDTDTRGLWRDRLADLGADRVDGRQQERRGGGKISDPRPGFVRNPAGGR